MREIFPWEKEIREIEERLSEKYGAEFELKKETKKSLQEILKKEIEQKMADFALEEWFEEHKEEFTEEGIPEEISKEKKISLAIEKGALKELTTKKEYEEKFEEIERLFTLRSYLEKKSLPTEILFLTLNTLEKKTEEISAEIKEMEKEGKSEVEISMKRKELENLSKLKEELAEKGTGRNLKEEGEREAKEKIVSKEEYIDQYFDSQKEEVEKSFKEEIFNREFKKQWEELSEKEKEEYGNNHLEFTERKIEDLSQKHELKKEEVFYLLVAGYNPEEFKSKGIFRKKIEVKKGEKIPLGKIEDFKKVQFEIAERKIREKVKEELGKKWEEEYQKLVKEYREEEIKKLAKFPEEAIKGIEEIYQKLKDRLIAERAEKELKKEGKTREEIKEIERKFERKGKDIIEFLREVLNFQKEQLSGDFESDKENLSKFLEKHLKEYGIDTSSKKLESLVDNKKYKEVAKKEKGFLRLLLELIFELFGEKI